MDNVNSQITDSVTQGRKRDLELINFEGPVLKAAWSDLPDRLVVWDQWDSIVGIYSLKEMGQFFDGQLEMVDSYGQSWCWTQCSPESRTSWARILSYLIQETPRPAAGQNKTYTLKEAFEIAQKNNLTHALNDFLNESPDMTVQEIILDFLYHYDLISD
jgi:hypothetical protein